VARSRLVPYRLFSKALSDKPAIAAKDAGRGRIRRLAIAITLPLNRMSHALNGLPEQRPKSHLPEVVVRRERVGQAVFLHHHARDAVG